MGDGQSFRRSGAGDGCVRVRRHRSNALERGHGGRCDGDRQFRGDASSGARSHSVDAALRFKCAQRWIDMSIKAGYTATSAIGRCPPSCEKASLVNSISRTAKRSLAAPTTRSFSRLMGCAGLPASRSATVRTYGVFPFSAASIRGRSNEARLTASQRFPASWAARRNSPALSASRGSRRRWRRSRRATRPRSSSTASAKP